MADVDRRAALEAAFDEVEGNTEPGADNVQNQVIEAPKSGDVSPEESQPAEGTGIDPETDAVVRGATEQEPEKVEEVKPVDAAPHSWKAATKSKWASVDPEVQQEVLRRDREVNKTLAETAEVRTFAKQFQEAIAPFAPRLQAMGAKPLDAVRNLLQADYALSNGSKQQRATLLVKLIKDYDVDIEALDLALAGKVTPQAQEESRLEEMLNQRLAPVTQFLTQQQQREQQAAAAKQQAMAAEVEALASDPVKYPHFEAVRDAMADLVEISERNGRAWDLKTLYNRAIAADPTLSAQAGTNQQTELAKLAAERAQRAKLASTSVRGAPGAGKGGAAPTDRRATIAAAFDSLGS